MQRPPHTALAVAVLALSVAGYFVVPGVRTPQQTVAPADTGSFTATFETPSDFFSRFVTDVGDYVDSNGARVSNLIDCCPWVDTPTQTHGDHSFACEGPDTKRTLDNADPDLAKYFWWCAPGNDPTKGHVMTGFDSTGYTVLSFSPNHGFNDVQRVCWDVNATDEGGGKWTNMIVVPEALYQQFAPRMDYVTAGFNGDNGPGDFNIQQGDHPDTKVWGVRDFRGSEHLYIGDDVVWQDDTAHVTTDKAARYKHCVERISASQSRLTVERPGGGTSTYTLPSAIPQGAVRVIFQDEMYDPPKRDGYNPDNVTWHWDNIDIAAGSITGPPVSSPPALPATVAYPPSAARQFDSLSPSRLLDTRGGSVRPAGSVTRLQVAGRAGVLAGARAVSLNVTAVGPQADGYVTVFPCGDVPNASNLNYRAGAVVANAVIANLDSGGAVCLFTSAASHLLVDVNGSFPAPSSFAPLPPARLYDSRPGTATVDGAGAGEGVRAAGTSTRVPVAGRAGVPAGATAAALNVTIVGAIDDGFATVFPCGSGIPNASNLNYRRGDVVANMVVSQLGSAGDVCVNTDGPAHLVVDVVGSFPAGDSFGGLGPARLLDTRQANATVDGDGSGGGATQAGGVVVVHVSGRGGVPTGAGAVALNVTAVDPTAAGFATVYPCGQGVPDASNLNFRPRDVVPNSAVSRVGSNGDVCIYTSASTQLLADVTGWFPA